jgi:hypothetical protein
MRPAQDHLSSDPIVYFGGDQFASTYYSIWVTQLERIPKRYRKLVTF